MWNIIGALEEELGDGPNYLKLAREHQTIMRVSGFLLISMPVVLFSCLGIGFSNQWPALLSIIFFTTAFVVYHEFKTKKYWWLRRGPIIYVKDVHSWDQAKEWLDQSNIPYHEVYSGTYKFYNSRQAVLFKLTWG